MEFDSYTASVVIEPTPAVRFQSRLRLCYEVAHLKVGLTWSMEDKIARTEGTDMTEGAAHLVPLRVVAKFPSLGREWGLEGEPDHSPNTFQ